MALLDISDLSVAIGEGSAAVRVLDRLSLSLDAGRSLGLVGESGSGKTVAALAVMGLLPDGATVTGSILFDERELVGASDEAMAELRGRRIAMVFGQVADTLDPLRSIGDQVGEGARLHLGLGARAAKAHTRELLARVGLPSDRFAPDLYPHQLARSQRQRVTIAIALAGQPSLLIVDEPVAGLKVFAGARILDLIADLAAEYQMGLIMISRDPGIIAETSDSMIVMYGGMVAESGQTSSLFRAPAHPYTQGLLDALPEIHPPAHGRGARLRTIPGEPGEPGSEMRIGCPFAPRCRRASPRCRASLPPPVAVSPGHHAACFYPVSS